MKNTIIFLTLVASFLILEGCMASLGSTILMLDADTNKDNSLSFNEFFGMQKGDKEEEAKAKAKGLTHMEYAKGEFENADKDKNKLLSKGELKKYIKTNVRSTNKTK